ncbi:helix-turn-helix transcriptional regulator [Cyanobium sp. Morenito 9A2]|nr:helix-turn-helix transcriptional regulator [Cyanobium sp. Morenito 9A2]
MDERKRVGLRIREIRLSMNWTQEDLAAATGLHPSYIGGIERGQRNVGLDNLLKISHSLRVHPSELFKKL